MSSVVYANNNYDPTHGEYSCQLIQNYFNELCKGNSGIIDLSAREIISSEAIYFTQDPKRHLTDIEVKELGYLIMIGNLLYNRTDSINLPIEDGVYDLLLEIYKVYNPNFQVGSAVIDFKSSTENSLLSKGIKIVNPLFTIPHEKKDEQREYFEKRFKSFDFNKFNYQDISQVKSPIYFTNGEKLSKRIHNTPHNHPELVGTLDKCKFVLDQDAIDAGVYDKPNVKILERDFFGKHIRDGIITEDQELELVLELKYDGISVEADCAETVLSARTRGDTGIDEASDISPILQGYQFPHNNLFIDESIGIKFEAIMTTYDLERYNKLRNYHYINCRTAIIGLFGSSDASIYRDFLTLIPLAVDRKQVPQIDNRLEEIELMNTLFKTHGEPLRYAYIKGNLETCLFLIKKFAEEARYARSYLNFMFDGIVISYLDENIRAKLGRENHINKYSMAVKFDPEKKLATFLGYSYTVGQTGAICPMIHYTPVEFFGAIHDKSTGSSLARFKELNLKPGDVLSITYNHDVMPYVNKLDCEQNRNNPNPPAEFTQVCPICGSPLSISSTGKQAFCTNKDCNGIKLGRTVAMLQRLNIKGFAEAKIAQLGIYTLTDFVQWYKNYHNIDPILGPTESINLYTALKNLVSVPIQDYILMGSLGFTDIAAGKWKIIMHEISINDLLTGLRTYPSEIKCKIANIKGIGLSTAETIFNEFPYYEKDIETIMKECKIISTSNLEYKKQIRFTGCRNSELVEQLTKKGYDISDGNVTQHTDILLVPALGFSSNKTSKVSENCRIIPINEFINHMDLYL